MAAQMTTLYMVRDIHLYRDISSIDLGASSSILSWTDSETAADESRENPPLDLLRATATATTAHHPNGHH
jgi:hypothetical protein